MNKALVLFLVVGCIVDGAKAWHSHPALGITHWIITNDAINFVFPWEYPDLRKFAASDESPICNIPLVVRSWGDNGAGLEVNGRKVEQGRNFRVGHRHLVDGSNLVVWIKLESTKPVSIRLTREDK